MAKTSSGMKRVSSIDVAKEAGVSQTTVSRVLSGKDGLVSEDTKNKVLEAMSKLGYRPSMIARSLSQNITNIIGIVITNFYNPLYMQALDLFTSVLSKKGYSLMLFKASDDKNVEASLKTALEYQVDGLIITSAQVSPGLIEGCLGFNTPVFLFNHASDGLNVSSVCCDNYAGGLAVADFLIDNGHKKLIYVSGDKYSASSTNRERERGFFDRAKSRGIEDIRRVSGDFSYNAGVEAARILKNDIYDFDAIFLSSDAMAKGFIEYIHNCTTYNIPDDISVIGFDGTYKDREIGGFYSYCQPMEKMVVTLVEQMVNTINNFSTETVHSLLPGKIVGCNSVKRKN